MNIKNLLLAFLLGTVTFGLQAQSNAKLSGLKQLQTSEQTQQQIFPSKAEQFKSQRLQRSNNRVKPKLRSTTAQRLNPKRSVCPNRQVRSTANGKLKTIQALRSERRLVPSQKNTQLSRLKAVSKLSSRQHLAVKQRRLTPKQ